MSIKSKVGISVSLILCVIFTVLSFMFRTTNNGILCCISFISFCLFMMQVLFIKIPIESMTKGSKVKFLIPIFLYVLLTGLMFVFPKASVILMFFALMSFTWFIMVNHSL